MIVLGVAFAGALGASCRFLLERWITMRYGSPFAWGTLVVNVSGSLTLGIVVGLALEHGLSTDTRTIVGTGFLGAYTTFSTYVYEVVRRAEDGHAHVALTYLLAAAAGGTIAATIGLGITGAL